MDDYQSPVITGIGTVSASAENSTMLWQHLLESQVSTSFHLLKEKEKKLPVYAAKKPLFSGASHRLVKNADRSALLALSAALEAWEQSSLSDFSYEAARIGVVVGSSRGNVSLEREGLRGQKKSPSAVVYGAFSSVAGLISDILGTEGMAMAVSSTCTSGATALHIAKQAIDAGTLDAAVVGGVDAPLVDSILEQYLAAGVLSTDGKLSPFDESRTGTILGEGAAFVVLESRKFAKARKASILAHLRSVILQSYPGQRASLDLKGNSLQNVIQVSLKKAELSSSDIDLIHLHGTATKRNDLIEARAVEAVFGKPEHQPFSWGTKAITGHTLGGSALFQVVLSIKALSSSLLLETVHCKNLDPKSPLKMHHGPPLKKSLAHIICLTSGFWGNVSSIVLSSDGI